MSTFRPSKPKSKRPTAGRRHSEAMMSIFEPETPPGFVVRTETQKVAFDNGFRLERGLEGGWLRYGSTTARGDVWIAGASPRGPWFLSVSHPGVAAELATSGTPSEGPGIASWEFSTLAGLYGAVSRAYQLGVSLPDAPLQVFAIARPGHRARRRLNASSCNVSGRTSSANHCSNTGTAAVR